MRSCRRHCRLKVSVQKGIGEWFVTGFRGFLGRDFKDASLSQLFSNGYIGFYRSCVLGLLCFHFPELVLLFVFSFPLFYMAFWVFLLMQGFVFIFSLLFHAMMIHKGFGLEFLIWFWKPGWRNHSWLSEHVIHSNACLTQTSATYQYREFRLYSLV